MARFSFAWMADGRYKPNLNIFQKSWLLAFLRFLVPSFLNGIVPGTTRLSRPSRPPHSAAGLDGLRGFAAFGVFHLHFAYTFCNDHDWVWGTRENDHIWYQLPFINSFLRGPSLVGCFFIISGYVLSLKPLKLLRAQSDEKFAQTMSSYVFRRAVRLYVPTLVATLVAMILVWVGAFQLAFENWHDGYSIFPVEEPPDRYDSFYYQCRDWLWSIAPLLDFWNTEKYYSRYDEHLWTIPVEFRGSMLLFLVLVGVSELSTLVRMLIEAGLAYYCIVYNQHELVLFAIGLFIAESHLIIADSNLIHRWLPSVQAQPMDPEKLTAKLSQSLKLRAVPIFFFIFGFYLMGMPFADANRSAFGYSYFISINSSPYFWQCFGPAVLVFLIPLSTTIAPIFTNPVAQYLGNISYAFYIVHGNVRKILIYSAMPAIWRLVGGKETQPSYAMGIIIAMAINYVFAFWAADVWWRAVDEPSIRLAKWLEIKCRRSEVIPSVVLSTEQEMASDGLGERDAFLPSYRSSDEPPEIR